MLAQGLPAARLALAVRVAEVLIYDTDSSVGVCYHGRQVRKYVLAKPTDYDDSCTGPALRVFWISGQTVSQDVCEGGEVHEVVPQQVFCVLIHG